MSLFKVLICFSLLIALSNSYEATWASLDSRPLPAWYDESKIGIFIHWGVFSVPSYGDEWFWYRWLGDNVTHFKDFMTHNYKPGFSYQDFATQFTAEFFDPSKWVNIFKASGAKYVVLTTKHHEGYTLWPSKYSYSWNSKDVGSHRDLVGEFTNAVRKSDLKLGLYHSLFEWFNPLYVEDRNSGWKTNKFVTSKIRPEMEELINNYKPDILWSDGAEAPPEYWGSLDFLKWLYNDSPVKDTVITNDRWGWGSACKHGGFWNCDDSFKPGKVQAHKWEMCMSVIKGSWGYRRDAQVADYLTMNEILSHVAETVSCGGNVLINVGASHDGIIKPIFEQRLRDLGAWLGVNGEGIYGTKAWTTQNDTTTKNVWYTSKGNNVYAIVLFYPTNGQLVLGSVSNTIISSIQLLGVSGNLQHSVSANGSLVTFPAIPPDVNGLRWAYVLKISTK